MKVVSTIWYRYAEPHCKCAIIKCIEKIHDISSILKNDRCYYFHTNDNFVRFLKMKRILERYMWWGKLTIRETAELVFCDVYTKAIIGMIIACFNFSCIWQYLWNSHVSMRCSFNKLLVFLFKLVCKRKFGGLFLQFGKFVFVFWDLFEGWFDEFTLHVTDRHVQFIDLEIS